MSSETNPFMIILEGDANRLLDKVLAHDERVARIEATAAEYVEEARKARDRFKMAALPALAAWLSANPPKGKARSRKLLSGTIGWRKLPGGPRVKDKAEVIDWALEHAPSLVEEQLTIKLDTAGVRIHVEATGELPPGVEVLEDGDRFYVKAPKVNDTQGQDGGEK